MNTQPIRDDGTHTGLASCLCTACAGDYDPRLLGDSTDEASLDPRAGETANNKPIWTAEQAAAYLNRSGGGFANGAGKYSETGNGRQNNIGDDNSVITFGFFENQNQLLTNGYGYTALNPQGVLTNYALGEYFNFASFNEAQRAATRESMQYWDDLVAVTFRETNADDADMNFGNLASAPQTQAYARIPTAGLDGTLAGQVREIGGDSWYSLSQASNLQLDEGLYGMNTLTHEIGHALGLSHPGQYNFGPGFSVNYANGAEYAQDARNYSIMSYWNPRDLGTTPTGVVTRDFDWSLMALAYGATPMVHDILAIQNIYGVDTTTRTGDTVYGFNSNAGRDAFDFNKTPWPTMAIWDAGGNDTLDASGYNVNQTIDLTPGSLSSIGGVTYAEALEKLTFEVVNANRAAAGYAPVTRATYDGNIAALAAQPDFRGRLTDNVGIAYGAVIENAIGGGGNDTLVANAAANRLTGNAGVDLVSYRLSTAGVSVSLAALTASGGFAQGDVLTGIESLEGSGFNDALTGDGVANTLIGLAGDDRLLGGAGDDFLVGGAGKDLVDGGAGFDTASYRDAAAGVTLTLTSNSVRAGGDATGDTFSGIEAWEGGAFADVLTGANQGDTLSGLGGNDQLFGAGGKDLLNGGDGDDALDGGNDDDVLNGGAGNDTLIGGLGADLLSGGVGNDSLDGGNADDVLNGGAGDDRLTGGSGADTFRFTDAGGSMDTIVDFRRGTDRIDLSGFGGVDAGDVKFDAGKILVDTNNDGVFDLTVVTTGVTITQADVLFG